jgi:hypothetical protein
MVRLANNSYHAVSYLGAGIPEDSNGKPSYMLAVPKMNRQLLGLLFSLVNTLDDIRKRSLEYQRAGWRELLEAGGGIWAEGSFACFARVGRWQ